MEWEEKKLANAYFGKCNNMIYSTSCIPYVKAAFGARQKLQLLPNTLGTFTAYSIC